MGYVPFVLFLLFYIILFLLFYIILFLLFNSVLMNQKDDVNKTQ